MEPKQLGMMWMFYEAGNAPAKYYGIKGAPERDEEGRVTVRCQDYGNFFEWLSRGAEGYPLTT